MFNFLIFFFLLLSSFLHLTDHLVTVTTRSVAVTQEWFFVCFVHVCAWWVWCFLSWPQQLHTCKRHQCTYLLPDHGAVKSCHWMLVAILSGALRNIIGRDLFSSLWQTFLYLPCISLQHHTSVLTPVCMPVLLSQIHNHLPNNIHISHLSLM